MSSNPLDDVQHWRNRAEQARVLAEQIDDALAREMMLRVASNYERIAARASGRQIEGEVRWQKPFHSWLSRF